MQAQRALSSPIVEAGGEYLWFVKDNQPTLLADLELLFERPRLAKGWSDPSTDFITVQRVEEGHGHLDERQQSGSWRSRAASGGLRMGCIIGAM